MFQPNPWPAVFHNPVVFFYNGIGDAFINLPALRALYQIFSGNLTLITGKWPDAQYVSIFQEIPFKKVIEIQVAEDFENKSKSVDVEQFKVALADADLLIWLPPWLPSNPGDVQSIVGNVRTVGYFSCFDYCVEADFLQNCFDLAFEIPRFFDPALLLEDFSSAPQTTPVVERLFTGLISSSFSNFKLLLVHNDSLPFKKWSDISFSSLLSKILEKYDDIGVIDIGLNKIQKDIHEVDQRIMTFDAPLSFEYMVGLIRMADYYIGIDSSFLHVADLCRKPLIGLYGPTSFKEWGIRFSRHQSVVAANGSMDGIMQEDVFQNFCKLVDYN